MQSERTGAAPRVRTVTPRRRTRELEIRAAAIELFQARGYEAATMRDLAQLVGMDAGSLYNHFRSKYDLLREVLIGTMEDLVARVGEAVEAARPEPEAELRAALTAYVEFHAERLHEAGIADSERRSLSPEDDQRLLQLRGQLAGFFRSAIERGQAAGDFVTADAGIATLCVLSLPARLPVWYRPEGRLTLHEIAEQMTDFVLHGIVGPKADRG